MSDLNLNLRGDITNSKSMRFDLDDVPHNSTCIEENLVRKNGTKASNDEDFMCVAAIKSSSSKDDNDPSSSPPTWTNVTLTQRIFLIGLRMMCFDRFWWMWSIIVVCYWTCAFVITCIIIFCATWLPFCEFECLTYTWVQKCRYKVHETYFRIQNLDRIFMLEKKKWQQF